jgi:hypothetical protein
MYLFPLIFFLTRVNGFSPLIMRNSRIVSSELSVSEWGDFKALDDDIDDDLGPPGKMKGFADENDPQEYKAEIGSTIPAPELSWDGDPIFLPQGSVLPLSDENVEGVLQACREEIGTMFGYSAENRGVGITGAVDFVELDGPAVVLKLSGKYHLQIMSKTKSIFLTF